MWISWFWIGKSRSGLDGDASLQATLINKCNFFLISSLSLVEFSLALVLTAIAAKSDHLFRVSVARGQRMTCFDPESQIFMIIANLFRTCSLKRKNRICEKQKQQLHDVVQVLTVKWPCRKSYEFVNGFRIQLAWVPSGVFLLMILICFRVAPLLSGIITRSKILPVIFVLTPFNPRRKLLSKR